MGKFMELEKHVCSLYEKIRSREINISKVMNYKGIVQEYAHSILIKEKIPSDNGLYSLLMLAIDQYMYSTMGEVIINDREYDMLMEIYISMGHERIQYADSFPTKWKMAKHQAPFMVGGIEKIYEFDKITDWFKELSQKPSFPKNNFKVVIAPKYDGISVNIELSSGTLVQALTKHNRIEGQDVTDAIRHSHNIDYFMEKYTNLTGFVKCELAMTQECFQSMEGSDYKNRRSATSGIFSTPKNIELVKYVDIVDLLSFNSIDKTAVYDPPGSIIFMPDINNTIERETKNLLRRIKGSEFPYRVDGCIIYPLLDYPSLNDVMEYSLAYKVNMETAETPIRYAYLSIGRKGRATPMIKVKPCDVNETQIEDIDAGSFDIFNKMELRENEVVEVFSAGDTKPQFRLLKHRTYKESDDIIKLDLVCPYCNHELYPIIAKTNSKFQNFNIMNVKMYECINPKCLRINVGRIANFIEKLGIKGFSDKTVEALYCGGLIRDIPDLLSLDNESAVKSIMQLDSFAETSARNIVNSVVKMKNTPINYSTFFGALGFPGLSTTLFSRIFQEITPKYLLGNNNTAYDALLSVPGLSSTRVEAAVDFLDYNRSEIKHLISIMTLVKDTKVKGRVVFTGFRDDHWKEMIEILGFGVSNAFNKEVVCVISGRLNNEKSKRAYREGIPVYLFTDIEDAYNYLKNYEDGDR